MFMFMGARCLDDLMYDSILFTGWRARDVKKGYSQVHGIDYNETFAPVAKMTP